MSERSERTPEGLRYLMIKIIVFVLSIVLPNTIYALTLSSNHAIVYDETNHNIVFQKNSRSKVSIASITKLMTAIVTLESNQDLSQIITITNKDIDRLKNTTSRIPIGTKITKDKALLLMLMSSENRAASALLRNYPGGYQEGLKAIDRKIKELNLISTKIVDSNGLNPNNTSSAIDLIKIVEYASKFDKIVRYSTTKSAVFNKNHYINSNPLVRQKHSSYILLSKTGFINEAGMCLVVKTKIKNRDYIVILLKSPSKNSRVNDFKRIYSWIQSSHKNVLTKR